MSLSFFFYVFWWWEATSWEGQLFQSARQQLSQGVKWHKAISSYWKCFLIINTCDYSFKIAKYIQTPPLPLPDRKPICQRIICLRKCMNVLVRLWIKVPPSVGPQTTASPPTSCPFNQSFNQGPFSVALKYAPTRVVASGWKSTAYMFDMIHFNR